MTETTLQRDIDELRQNFDAMYIGAIPQLLTENGAFLAFLATLTGTEALAGFFAPQQGVGQRFTGFIELFFPPSFGKHANDFWTLRNLMVHAFNPGPFALVCGQSRLHLTTINGLVVLNAEDFYSALVVASQNYFGSLYQDLELQNAFVIRLKDKDGGGIQSFTVQKGSANANAA